MREARIVGNYVDFLCKEKGMSLSGLSEVLGCNNDQAYAFLKGRLYASYSQMTALAKALGTTVDDLFAGNRNRYDATVVHCMNEFQHPENREEILDLIDNYIDIFNAVAAK